MRISVESIGASHHFNLARARRHRPRDDVGEVDLLFLRRLDLAAKDEVVGRLVLWGSVCMCVCVCEGESG